MGEERALLSDLIASSEGIADLTHRHISYAIFQLLCKVARFNITGFVHSNISPENVTISANGTLELLDKSSKLSYKAPEQLLEMYDWQKADVWSIGTIFAEMLTGKVFFPSARDRLQQWITVVDTIGSPGPQFFNKIPQHTYQEICRAPRSNGKSAYQLLPIDKCSLPTDKAPLNLNNACDLLGQMLLIDCDDRVTAEEALQHPYVNFWLGYHWTRGMRQLYKQGLKLKERYTDYLKFMNPNYSSKDIYVRSTDYDRTLMSAYSNLLGFYSASMDSYPLNIKGWPKRYSPIPVHTVNKTTDHLLYIYRQCPRMERLMKEQRENPNFRRYMNKQTEYFDYISKMSGTPISSLNMLHDFIDTVYIERLYNKTGWITDSVFKKGVAIKDATDDYHFGSAGFGRPENVELVRIQGGVLLKTMIENMVNVVKGKDQPRFHAYSAHDTTMFSFLRTLNAKIRILGPHNPDYGSMAVLELWKLEGQYHVRLLYSANSDSPLKSYTNAISGCPEKSASCPLENFIKRSEKYLVHDPHQECQEKSISNNTTVPQWVTERTLTQGVTGSKAGDVIIMLTFTLCAVFL